MILNKHRKSPGKEPSKNHRQENEMHFLDAPHPLSMKWPNKLMARSCSISQQSHAERSELPQSMSCCIVPGDLRPETREKAMSAVLFGCGLRRTSPGNSAVSKSTAQSFFSCGKDPWCGQISLITERVTSTSRSNAFLTYASQIQKLLPKTTGIMHRRV